MHFSLFYGLRRWQMRYKSVDATSRTSSIRRQTDSNHFHYHVIHSFIPVLVQSIVHALIHIIFHSKLKTHSDRRIRCEYLTLPLSLSVRLSTYLSHSRLSFINLNNVNFLPRLSTVAANPGNLPGTPGKRFPFDSDKHITIVNLCVSIVIYLWSYTLAVVSSYRIMSTHFTVGVSNSCALRQFIIITIVFHIFVRSWIFFYLLGLCNRNKYGMWLSEGSLEKSLRFCFV